MSFFIHSVVDVWCGGCLMWWMSGVVDVWCGGCPILLMVWWMSGVVDVWCGGCLCGGCRTIDNIFMLYFSGNIGLISWSIYLCYFCRYIGLISPACREHSFAGDFPRWLLSHRWKKRLLSHRWRRKKGCSPTGKDANNPTPKWLSFLKMFYIPAQICTKK